MARGDLIQLRRGTAAEWATTGQTLANGEPGFVTDENALIIGDGTTEPENLPRISVGVNPAGDTMTGPLNIQRSSVDRIRIDNQDSDWNGDDVAALYWTGEDPADDSTRIVEISGLVDPGAPETAEGWMVIKSETGQVNVNPSQVNIEPRGGGAGDAVFLRRTPEPSITLRDGSTQTVEIYGADPPYIDLVGTGAEYRVNGSPLGAGEVITAGAALTKTGTTLDVNAGDGLKIETDTLKVDPGAGLQIEGDNQVGVIFGSGAGTVAEGSDLTAHMTGATDAHDASAISYAGGTGVSAVNVEAALDELATEKQDKATFPVCIGVALSDETSVITTGTAKVTIRAPFAFTLAAVRASLTTVSSSGVVTVDINEGGTTVLSTKLTVDASEKTSTTAATAAVISDASIADDAELTFDIDTAGTGATGLKVWLIGTRSV